MRRTDVSRRMGIAMSRIEDAVAQGAILSTEDLTNIVSEEIGLSPNKPNHLGEYTIVIFKDSNFECALKKNDLYTYDSKIKFYGIKEIRNNFGTVQLIHHHSSTTGANRVELKMVIDADYIDFNGRRLKAYPCLKSLESLLNDEETEDTNNLTMDKVEQMELSVNGAIEGDTNDTEDSSKVIEAIENDVESPYSSFIQEAVTKVFKMRFYDSIPSEEFVGMIEKEIHDIYTRKYIEKLYTEDNIKDNDNESIQVIQRIMNTI